MTQRIQVLDELLVRQIAAGEVLERPASALKELLENAIDAGARNIEIYFAGSGKEVLRISDDGCGIAQDQIALALTHHATSKIKSLDDLAGLHTFGFRGEALPSIAAVSRMTLLSRSDEDATAARLEIEGGVIQNKKIAARALGTTIEVRDIFYNTPARLKFMKSDATERSRLMRVFEEVAIAHPEIAFVLEAEKLGRKTILPKVETQIQRICDLWGKNAEENWFALNMQHAAIKVTGWVSRPQAHQASRNYQLLYVNRRPIISRSLNHALYEAYRDALPVGRHPMAVIFIDIDPATVDFNVHPAKREVRFQNESQIYEVLIKEIRLRRSEMGMPLKETTQEPLAAMRSTQNFSYPKPGPMVPKQPSFFSREPLPVFSPPAKVTEPTAAQAGPQVAVQEQKIVTAFRVIDQIQALYILAEWKDNLVIVDQHAAAERVLYEKFKRELDNGGIVRQTLLIPLVWTVTLAEAALVRENLSAFSALGFVLEEFGERSFRIREYPSALNEKEILSLLEEILAGEENTKVRLVPEKKLMSLACRAAVKAGDRISKEEQLKILNDLSACQNPHTCPHGRPTTLQFSRAELDKKFDRI